MAFFLTICVFICLFCLSFWRKVTAAARQQASEVAGRGFHEDFGGSYHADPFAEAETDTAFEPAMEEFPTSEEIFVETHRSSKKGKSKNRSHKEASAHDASPMSNAMQGIPDTSNNVSFDLRQAVIAQTILQNDYLSDRY